jgi:hypothetical protein
MTAAVSSRTAQTALGCGPAASCCCYPKSLLLSGGLLSFAKPITVVVLLWILQCVCWSRCCAGSRPASRKQTSGIEGLRAIPWVFAWTQTRFHLPVRGERGSGVHIPRCKLECGRRSLLCHCLVEVANALLLLLLMLCCCCCCFVRRCGWALVTR